MPQPFGSDTERGAMRSAHSSRSLLSLTRPDSPEGEGVRKEQQIKGFGLCNLGFLESTRVGLPFTNRFCWAPSFQPDQDGGDGGRLSIEESSLRCSDCDFFMNMLPVLSFFRHEIC